MILKPCRLAYIANMNDNKLYIIQEIFGDSYELFYYKEQLDRIQGNVEIMISSNGGDVFNGLKLRTLIQERIASGDEVKTTGFGLVASISSVILLSGSLVSMYKDSFLMIHNSLIDGYYSGGAEDLEKDAKLLREINETALEIYVDKIVANYPNKDKEEVKEEIEQLMKEETFLTATQALQLGLIDEIVEEQSESAQASVPASAKLQIKDKRNKRSAQRAAILQKFQNFKNNMNTETNSESKEKSESSLFRRFLNLFKNESSVKKIEEALEGLNEEAIEQEQQEQEPDPVQDAINLLQEKGFSITEKEQAQEASAQTENEIEQLKAQLKAQNKKLEKMQMKDTTPTTGKEEFTEKKAGSRIKQAKRFNIKKPKRWNER